MGDNRRKKIYKILSLTVAGLMVTSLAAGCGSKSTAQGSSESTSAGGTAEKMTESAMESETTAGKDMATEQTEKSTQMTDLSGSIEMWSTFTDVENKVLTDKIVPAFNQKYPNIKVTITPMPGGDDYKKQILQAALSGTTPDLARTDITDVALYAKEDYILPMDNMPGFDSLKQEMFAGPMDTNKYNGHYYGIPLDANTKIAIYNKSMLTKAGFTEAPKTMEELEQFAQKMKADKVMGIGIGGTESWAIGPYFLSLGGQFLAPDNSKATGYLNSPASVKALEKIISWNDNGYVAKSLLGGEGTWEGFNAGHYGMIDDGPWWYPANKDQKLVKDNVVFAPIPQGDGGSLSIVGGEDTIIFKASKNQQQAYAFASFLASDDAQTIFATELSMMPVNSKTAQKSVVSDDPMLKVYSQQLASTWARTPSPKWSDISSAIKEDMESAIRKKMTAQAALDDAAKKVDALLQAN